jgi:hypothetical protein
MFKRPINTKGEIQFFEVFKIAILFAVIFVLLSNLFERHQTIPHAGPILIVLMHSLIMIQSGFIVYQLSLELIHHIKKYVFVIITYKPHIHQQTIQKTIKEKETFINQNIHLNIQVMRC